TNTTVNSAVGPSTTIVESVPPVVQVVDPTPTVQTVVETQTVQVGVEVGLSIERGLGGVYAPGDALGVGFVVSQPMEVEVALVLKESRLGLYQGGASGPTGFASVVPRIPGG